MSEWPAHPAHATIDYWHALKHDIGAAREIERMVDALGSRSLDDVVGGVRYMRRRRTRDWSERCKLAPSGWEQALWATQIQRARQRRIDEKIARDVEALRLAEEKAERRARVNAARRARLQKAKKAEVVRLVLEAEAERLAAETAANRGFRGVWRKVVRSITGSENVA